MASKYDDELFAGKNYFTVTFEKGESVSIFAETFAEIEKAYSVGSLANDRVVSITLEPAEKFWSDPLLKM